MVWAAQPLRTARDPPGAAPPRSQVQPPVDRIPVVPRDPNIRRRRGRAGVIQQVLQEGEVDAAAVGVVAEGLPQPERRDGVRDAHRPRRSAENGPGEAAVERLTPLP